MPHLIVTIDLENGSLEMACNSVVGFFFLI